MAMPMSGNAALQIQGSRQSGQDVRLQNITAVAAIANIVKTSLGPVGLDKVSTVRHALQCWQSCHPARAASQCTTGDI